MKGFRRQCRILPMIIVSCMSLILALLGHAADTEFPSESEIAPESGTQRISNAEIKELWQLLEKQKLQLAAQQEEIENQRSRLQSI